MKRWIWRGLLALVVVVLITVGALALWQRSLQKRYDEAMAALVPSDLAAFAIAVPPEDDARPLLEELKRWSADDEQGSYTMHNDVYGDDPAEWADCEAWLDSQTEVRALIRRIAAKPACSRPYDAAVPPYEWRITTGAIRTAAQVLEWELQINVQRGDESTADALRRATLLLALRRHADDRFFVPWYLHLFLEQEALDHVRVIGVANFDAVPRLRAWIAALESEEGRRPVLDVLRNERLAMQAVGVVRMFDGWVAALRRYGKDAPWVDATIADRIGVVENWALHSPAARLLELRAALRWLDEDTQAIAAVTSVDYQTFKRLKAMESTIAPRWGDPFGSAVTSIARRMVGSLLEQRARLAITAAGLDAIAWRAKHGAWPESVDADDPYTGDKLHYEVTLEGVTISSEASDDLEWRIK